jgi:hypothetical protein
VFRIWQFSKFGVWGLGFGLKSVGYIPHKLRVQGSGSTDGLRGTLNLDEPWDSYDTVTLQ